MREARRPDGAVAELLGVRQCAVERYVKKQIRRARSELAARLEREVCTRWRPRIKATAEQAAAAPKCSAVAVVS